MISYSDFFDSSLGLKIWTALSTALCRPFIIDVKDLKSIMSIIYQFNVLLFSNHVDSVVILHAPNLKVYNLNIMFEYF